MFDKKILDAFEAIEIDKNEIQSTTLLSEELGMDSQEFIELQYHLEKIFSVRLPDDFAVRAKTVIDIENMLASVVPGRKEVCYA